MAMFLPFAEVSMVLTRHMRDRGLVRRAPRYVNWLLIPTRPRDRITCRTSRWARPIPDAPCRRPPQGTQAK